MYLESILTFCKFICNNVRSTYFFKVNTICYDLLQIVFCSFEYFASSYIALSWCKTSKPLNNISGLLNGEFWQLQFLFKVFLGSMKVGSSGRTVVFVTYISFYLSWFFWREFTSWNKFSDRLLMIKV